MTNRVDKILEIKESNGKEKRPSAPPERVANFIRRVIRGEKFYPGAERRNSLRYPITMPVKSTPLDERQRPTEESFLGVTRDISIGGLCMYHLNAVSARFLQLELTSHSDEQLHVVLEVVRCRQTGPFFEIAGRFVGSA
jgi:PilZ domain